MDKKETIARELERRGIRPQQTVSRGSRPERQFDGYPPTATTTEWDTPTFN